MKLTSAQRRDLPASAFAIPEWRWGPLVDARHVGNAASRLEHEHRIGTIRGVRYARATRRIASAARKFGVHSMYLNPVRSEDFWDTPAGIAVQAAAGVGLLASVYVIVKNWGPGSAAITTPVATEVLFAG